VQTDATGAQVEADEHLGHCHAMRSLQPEGWQGFAGQLICERPVGHTGIHTTCGHRPDGVIHSEHEPACYGW
jgi:hypothetical protein